MNRSHKSRLRKVGSNLDKALDLLHRSLGELYPEPLQPHRAKIEEAVNSLTTSRLGLEDALKSPSPTPSSQGGQTDLEEYIPNIEERRRGF